MRIYLIRHGQTAWNKEGRRQGSRDIPLDETGITQSRQLAERMAAHPVSSIYTSPLRRAVTTAEMLFPGQGAEIICRPELQEIRLGEWEGFTVAEIKARHGALFEEWETNPNAVNGVGVENIQDMQDRAYRAFCEITAQEQQDFIIVSHGIWIASLLCKLLHIPLAYRKGFEVSNAGISIIDCDKEGPVPCFRVVSLNDISHTEVYL